MTTDEVIRQMEEKMMEAVEKVCVVVEADTKTLCPVLTGTLRRSYTHSIQKKPKKVVGVVGTNVEYAFFVDRKRPHLIKAIDQTKQQIEDIIKDTLPH